MLVLENTQLKIPSIRDTDVLYLKLLDTDFVILNSTEAIVDLTEKRSNIYSDRVSPLVKHTPVLTNLYVANQPQIPMLEL